MFTRQWKWFGKAISTDGFTLAYGNRTVTYRDKRGSFQFGFEDGFLFPHPTQTAGKPLSLKPSEVTQMLEHIVKGLRSEGQAVQIFLGDR